MSYSVEVGAIERLIDVFVQDATVSTGAGLPNVHATSFSSYWHRSDMTSTSSVEQTTGTLGTWSSGTWTQVNSTFMRGWYQFACPNGMFATGSTVALHMYGHPSMAPAVKAIDITRINFQSPTVDANRVGVSSFGLPVGVSSFSLRVGVSSIDQRVGVSSFDLPVGVSSFDIRVGVSSFNSPVGVSSFDLPVGVSSFGIAVGVSTIGVAVSTSWFSGGTIVTSAPGVLSVNVSSIQGGSAVTTAAGLLTVDAARISGVASAADRLEAWTNAFISGTVSAGATASTIPTDVTEATDNHFNNMIFAFTGGALLGQGRRISNYVGATSTFSIQPDLTEIPAQNDTWIVVPLIAAGLDSGGRVDLGRILGSDVVTSVAGVLSANVQRINGVAIVGDGSGTPFNV